jgi:SAM-dependent methyltransferase
MWFYFAMIFATTRRRGRGCHLHSDVGPASSTEAGPRITTSESALQQPPIPSEYLRQNLATYDQLAQQYEDRIETTMSLWKQCVGRLATYLPRGASVLDVGCGVGGGLRALSEFGFDPTGIDIAPNMVGFARRRNPETAVVLGDFLTHAFGRQFDAIISFAFIHLFPIHDAMRSMAKMHSILKPGGILYQGTTKSSAAEEGFERKADYYGNQVRYRRRWTVHELTSAVKQSGFLVLDLEEVVDPYEKKWVDLICRKDVIS